MLDHSSLSNISESGISGSGTMLSSTSGPDVSLFLQFLQGTLKAIIQSCDCNVEGNNLDPNVVKVYFVLS